MKNYFYIFGMIVGLLILPISGYAQVQSVSVVQDPVFGTNQYVLLLGIGTLYSDRFEFTRIDESPSSLMSKDPSSFKIENPFSLAWQTSDEYTKFPTNYMRQIYNINIKFSEQKLFGWGEGDIANWVNSNCFDFDKDGILSFIRFKNIFGATMKLGCAGNSGYVGDVMTVGSGRPYWKTQFQFGNGQEVLTETLESEGSDGLVKNINNKVYIRFDGLILFSYPTTNANILMFKSGQSFTIFDINNLNTVTDLYKADATGYVSQVFYGVRTELDAENYLKTTIQNAINTWTLMSDWPVSRVSLDGSNIKLTTTERISFQNFNVYLNGNWIKIIIPFGMPKIVSVKADFGTTLTATKVGTITASVRNDGNDIATFQVLFDCGKSSEIQGTQMISNIGKGETRSVSFQINSEQVTNDVEDTCTITAQDTTKLENKDTYTFTYTIEPRITDCQEGEQIARFENNAWAVYECDANGAFTDKTITCNTGEILTKDILGRYNGCETGEQDGGGGFKWEDWMYILLIIPAIGIFAVLVKRYW